MSDFQLSGDGGPSFKHPEKSAFSEPPAHMKLRQTIWSLLQADLDKKYLLSDLVTITGLPAGKCYRAARILCRKGLAKREDVWLPKPTKADPDKKKPFLSIHGVAPFETKKSGSW